MREKLLHLWELLLLRKELLKLREEHLKLLSLQQLRLLSLKNCLLRLPLWVGMEERQAEVIQSVLAQL